MIFVQTECVFNEFRDKAKPALKLTVIGYHEIMKNNQTIQQSAKQGF